MLLSIGAAHYRLFANRRANDSSGAPSAWPGGISMCTYRVTHRLHHNNLYGAEDPDTAIHGGYPRGKAYLWNKLVRDLAGLNAWKTFAYFFGAPAINADTRREIRPLDDTSPELRAAARRDRLWVVAFHLAAPLLALGAGGRRACCCTRCCGCCRWSPCCSPSCGCGRCSNTAPWTTSARR
jgi:fatty acid desaturase